MKMMLHQNQSKSSYAVAASMLIATTSLVLILDWCSLITQAAPASDKRATSDKQFETSCLKAHNKWRRLHGAPELVIDRKIVAFAQKRADFIAESSGDRFEHPPDLPFGENLAYHSKPTSSCASLVKMWYDEVNLYDFRQPKFSHEAGHFTQLVWKDTRRIGCARATSPGRRGSAMPMGGIYLVCNYDPPGNFLGEFEQNVLKKQSKDRIPPPTSEVAPPTAPPTATTTTTTTTTTVAPSTTTTTTTAGSLDSSKQEEGQQKTTKKPNNNKKKSNGKRKNKKNGNKNKKKNPENKKRRNKNKKPNQNQESSPSAAAAATTPSITPSITPLTTTRPTNAASGDCSRVGGSCFKERATTIKPTTE